MFRKFWVMKMLSCGGLFFIILLSCIGSKVYAAKADITLWAHTNMVEFLKVGLTDYYKKHPDVNIQLVPVPSEETGEKLLLATIAGKGAPDITFIQEDLLARFKEAEGMGLVDLSQPPYNAGELEPYFVARRWKQQQTRGGKHLAIPEDICIKGIFYRRDLFEEAGVSDEPIKTWDDFIAIGEKITRDIDGDGKMDRWMITNAVPMFWHFAYADNSYFFNEKGELMIDKYPSFKRGLEMAIRMKKAGISRGVEWWGPEQQTAMKKGTIAVFMEALWYDMMPKTWAPKTAGKWGVMPLPEGEVLDHPATGVLVISDQSKHKLEAWEYVKYTLGSIEGLTGLYAKWVALSSYKPVWPILSNPDPFYGGQNICEVFYEMARSPNMPTKLFVYNSNDMLVRDILDGEVRAALKEVEEGKEVDVAKVLAGAVEKTKEKMF